MRKKENREEKEKERKCEDKTRFKVNKLFLYITLNSFHNFFLFYITIK